MFWCLKGLISYSPILISFCHSLFDDRICFVEEVYKKYGFSYIECADIVGRRECVTIMKSRGIERLSMN